MKYCDISPIYGFGFNAEHNNNNNDQEALLAPVLHQQSTRTITQTHWKETHRRSDTLSGPLYNLYDTKLNLHRFHFLSKIKTKFTGILKPPHENKPPLKGNKLSIWPLGNCNSISKSCQTHFDKNYCICNKPAYIGRFQLVIKRMCQEICHNIYHGTYRLVQKYWTRYRHNHFFKSSIGLIILIIHSVHNPISIMLGSHESCHMTYEGRSQAGLKGRQLEARRELF